MSERVEKVRFRPLWTIHNKTYRVYKRMHAENLLLSYGGKLFRKVCKRIHGRLAK